MKNIIHSALKLMLVILIFTGLQGRVIVRFLEVPQVTHTTKSAKSSPPIIRKGIIHCKLQSYTQHFQILAVPVTIGLLIILLFPILLPPLFISYNETVDVTNWHRRRPLRGPPQLF